jgi:hypothetical protein
MKLKFDIAGTPPSADILAQARKSAADVLAVCVTREQRFKWACYGLWLMGIAIVLLMWHGGLLSGNEAVCAALFATLIVGIVVAFFVEAGGTVAVGAGVGATAYMVVGVVAGESLATVEWVTVVVTAGVGACVGAYLYDRWIGRPRNAADQTLADLIELEASTLGEQCIAFMACVDANSTVRSYQNQIASMGRKPVMAEYEAAKDWIGDRERRVSEQGKIELARQACARMAVAG